MHRSRAVLRSLMLWQSLFSILMPNLIRIWAQPMHTARNAAKLMLLEQLSTACNPAQHDLSSALDAASWDTKAKMAALQS